MKQHHLSLAIILPICATLLAALSGIVGNIASSELPSWSKPLLPYAWPAFIVLLLLSIGLVSWQTKYDETAKSVPVTSLPSSQSYLANRTTKSGMSRRDAADRRAGTHQGPYVANGKLPRSRNNDGTWRKKRSDVGKKRSA